MGWGTTAALFMDEILQGIWAGLIGATWLEQSATVLGVLGVWLMIRQNLWAFPIGMVQVSLSAVVFYQYQLYADAKLQGFFFVVLAYGWWHWVRGCGDREELPVTRLRPRGIAGYALLGATGAGLWGWLLATRTDADLPYWDAFIAAFSIVSQWLQARKKLENWAGWMLVNSVAIGVYWYKELYWFSVLYALFFCMAAAGHRAWSTSRRSRGNG